MYYSAQTWKWTWWWHFNHCVCNVYIYECMCTCNDWCGFLTLCFSSFCSTQYAPTQNLGTKSIRQLNTLLKINRQNTYVALFGFCSCHTFFLSQRFNRYDLDHTVHTLLYSKIFGSLYENKMYIKREREKKTVRKHRTRR